MTAIPVIDISRAVSPSLADRQALAREIDRACASIGFLVISGHGVANALVDDAKRAASALRLDMSTAAPKIYCKPQ